MKFNFNLNLKVSAFYLEKQKSLVLKKKDLSHCQFQNKKALFTVSIFPKVLILTFKSRIYLDIHSRLQSYRTLIVTTSFVCTPYQKNAPQISQTETLIYLGPVLNALPIKKNARQISASIDNDLFLTSFACTPYQKIHLKFKVHIF